MPLDHDLDRYLESLEDTEECRMCGTEIKKGNFYCSSSCARADER